MIRARGFTLVELMVTMAVGSLLVVAAVGMYLTVLGQSPVVKTRNTLSTNLQSALSRINDDVRRSSNVTTYNLVPDANAPTSKVGYENVPGPETDTDDQYYWRMGESRLLLNQTPVDSSSNPIYDNVQYAVGKKNTIIYYVRDGALYRRVVAAPYPTNSVSTTTCTRVAEGGCITSDIKLVDNLKASLGAGAFKLIYYDRNGNPINYTVKDENGADIPSYTGFPLTRSIGVTIELESGPISGNQTVSIKNTMRMQFRSQLNVVPPTTVNPPYVPPTNGVGEPGLMVGPGGLEVANGKVDGGDVYVKGKVTVGFNGQIGGGWFGPFPGGNPINLNVANVGCGTGATYPSPCGPSSQPITATAAFASINGKVCAKDQSTPTNINAYGSGQGLIPGCVPPDVDMPAFDKASFTNSMNNGTATGASVSCNGGSTSFAANRTYTGNVGVNFFCNATLNGSVYITGNLSMSSYGSFRVSESVGKVRPLVVVNGKISVTGSVIPNSYGTTPYFISFFSSDSTCSNSNSCNALTPTKLKETLDNYTGAAAPVYLLNVRATGTSYYAYFGEANADFFSTVGAIAGQRVKIGTSSQVILNGAL